MENRRDEGAVPAPADVGRVDPSQSTEVMIGWEVHALSESISELTRYAVSHRDLLKRDVRELHIHYNRLALVISALEAEPMLQAAE